MRYDWDIDKLKELRRALNRLKTSEISKDELANINGDLENINEMLSIMKNPYAKVRIIDDIDDNKFFDRHKLISMNKYNAYKEILPYVEKIMIKLSKKMSKLYNDYVEIGIPRLTNTKELISLSYEVYKSLPTKSNTYKDRFLKYTNPRNNNIKIIQNEINSNFSVYGYIYFFQYPTYEPYIIMTQDKTLEDISVLCHELGHAIFYDPSITTLNRNYYLGEVEGYYFEYMARKYIQKMGYEKYVTNELEYRRFTTVYDEYISFYIMRLLINKYNFNKKIDLDKLMRYLTTKVDRNFNVDCANEAYINYSLNQNNHNVSKYIMSYLTFLDIEEMDKKDPELAFNMLKEVCKIEGDYILPKLRQNHITFMDDGCKNLEKKIRQMNRI